MQPDMINGLFEAMGAILVLLSVHKLSIERVVRGVHWLPVLFFTCWGYWNLFYYTHLVQPISFIGGVCLVAVNTVWLIQMIYFVRREHRYATPEMDMTPRIRRGRH